MNTLDVISLIIARNPTIAQLSFHMFPPASLVQNEIQEWREDENSVFERAMVLKNTMHLPFWSGIMISSFNNPRFPNVFLKAALHHNHIESLNYVYVKDIPRGIGNSNAICSVVKMTDGREAHIPMVDFHIPPSPDNLEIVKDVCPLLGLKSGWILDSGESYHFIGAYSVPWDSLHLVLSKALVFNPIVDIAWISHQLRESSCSLRIGEKNGHVPEVVWEI